MIRMLGCEMGIILTLVLKVGVIRIKSDIDEG